MSRRSVAVRVIRPGDPDPRDPVHDPTPQEPLEMIGLLAPDASAAMGQLVTDENMPRSVLHIIRLSDRADLA